MPWTGQRIGPLDSMELYHGDVWTDGQVTFIVPNGYTPETSPNNPQNSKFGIKFETPPPTGYRPEQLPTNPDRDDTELFPYIAAPIPDNAGASIGPQVWSTVTASDSLVPGPLTMTDGTDFILAGTMEEITVRLESGWRPLRPNGDPAYVQTFLGGYLIDGNPLNVLLGGPWLPEQIDAIQPAIQAGQVPSPSIPWTPAMMAAESSTIASDGFSQFALPATGLAALAILWAWHKRRKGN